MKDEHRTQPGEAADSAGEDSVSNGGNGGGESASLDPNFGWTYFYEAMANRLLAFRSRRVELLAKVCELDDNLREKNLEDICPFSVMAKFNLAHLGFCKEREEFAKSLACSLDISEISELAPKNFGYVGIPNLIALTALYFPPLKEERKGAVDTMWELFAYALDLASGMEEKRDAFTRSYDKALGVNKVGVAKLTIGLYWIRPRFFLSLDGNSWDYIKDKLGIPIPCDGPQEKGPSGESYLALRKKFLEHFRDENYPAHSFPELAFKSAEYTERKERERKKAEEAASS